MIVRAMNRRIGALVVVVGILVAGGIIWAWDDGQLVTGPCRVLHSRINDSMVVSVGAASTWGVPSPSGVRYPGYRDSDKLAVCLRPGGQVTGVFLRDGKQITMWHQTPDDELSLPV